MKAMNKTKVMMALCAMSVVANVASAAMTNDELETAVNKKADRTELLALNTTVTDINTQVGDITTQVEKHDLEIKDIYADLKLGSAVDTQHGDFIIKNQNAIKALQEEKANLSDVKAAVNDIEDAAGELAARVDDNAKAAAKTAGDLKKVEATATDAAKQAKGNTEELARQKAEDAKLESKVNALDEKIKGLKEVGDVASLAKRTDGLEKDLKKVGASAAALAALKPISYNPAKPTQIMAGVGTYRGSVSTALGVAHYKNENTMFHVGAAYGGGKSFMANAGVTLAVGAGNDKAMYLGEGPISSVYALQQEVAAMKAENEQMKAALQQLMAK